MKMLRKLLLRTILSGFPLSGALATGHPSPLQEEGSTPKQHMRYYTPPPLEGIKKHWEDNKVEIQKSLKKKEIFRQVGGQMQAGWFYVTLPSTFRHYMVDYLFTSAPATIGVDPELSSILGGTYSVIEGGSAGQEQPVNQELWQKVVENCHRVYDFDLEQELKSLDPSQNLASLQSSLINKMRYWGAFQDGINAPHFEEGSHIIIAQQEIDDNMKLFNMQDGLELRATVYLHKTYEYWKAHPYNPSTSSEEQQAQPFYFSSSSSSSSSNYSPSSPSSSSSMNSSPPQPQSFEDLKNELTKSMNPSQKRDFDKKKEAFLPREFFCLAFLKSFQDNQYTQFYTSLSEEDQRKVSLKAAFLWVSEGKPTSNGTSNNAFRMAIDSMKDQMEVSMGSQSLEELENTVKKPMNSRQKQDFDKKKEAFLPQGYYFKFFQKSHEYVQIYQSLSQKSQSEVNLRAAAISARDTSLPTNNAYIQAMNLIKDQSLSSILSTTQGQRQQQSQPISSSSSSSINSSPPKQFHEPIPLSAPAPQPAPAKVTAKKAEEPVTIVDINLEQEPPLAKKILKKEITKEGWDARKKIISTNNSFATLLKESTLSEGDKKTVVFLATTLSLADSTVSFDQLYLRAFGTFQALGTLKTPVEIGEYLKKPPAPSTSSPAPSGEFSQPISSSSSSSVMSSSPPKPAPVVSAPAPQPASAKAAASSQDVGLLESYEGLRNKLTKFTAAKGIGTNWDMKIKNYSEKGTYFKNLQDNQDVAKCYGQLTPDDQQKVLLLAAYINNPHADKPVSEIYSLALQTLEDLKTSKTMEEVNTHLRKVFNVK